MNIIDLPLHGAKLIEPMVHGDHRGFFMESYHEERYQEAGVDTTFIQDNHSLSQEAGVVRGLHYQLLPKAQSKLVRVLSGAVYDVILDIRRSSPTYGQWAGVILSEYNRRQLYVPKGFAHGFCTLVPNTQVFYKVDEYYSPELDRGIRWNDPALAIDWPVSAPILSDKDRNHPLFKDADHHFE